MSAWCFGCEDCVVDPRQAHFDALFRTYYQEIYRYVCGRDPANADDLVQETFLALYDNLDQIEPTTVRAWLYRVAGNKGVDVMRSSKRRQSRDEVAQSAASPSSHEAAETQALVRLALEKLKPRDAQILELHSCGLSYSELADVLGVKPSSISQLLYRAKQAFALHYQHLQSE